jgi:uncharacterized protein YbjT (DUF2867 family)
MNVLITGGTGFVGQAVVRHLRQAGHRPIVLARRPNAAAARTLAEEHDARIVSGNLLEPETLPAALADCDAIVHLVGIISEVGVQTFENVHVNATGALIEAARNSRVRRFIHMSALGTRPNAISRYHQTKYAAEQLVRQGPVPWTIFRPSLIYGPGDAFVNLFVRIARFSPVLPVIGDGRARFQPVSVEVVARAFALALTEPGAEGGTFDLCGADSLTLPELVETILRVTGRRRVKIPLPFALARIQAALLEVLVPLLLRRAPPLNRDQIIMLEEGNVGDGQPARDLFALRQESFADGIASYLAPKPVPA